MKKNQMSAAMINERQHAYQHAHTRIVLGS